MPKLPASLERSAIVKAIRSENQGAQVVKYDQYVTDHIRRTGRSVQATDIAQALATLAVGWMAFLFTAALAEHWLTARGFSSLVRYFLFGAAALVTARFVQTRLWPLLTGRINPLYTARAIEQSAPSLKNSLINLLTLRGGGRPLPTAVLATLEQQAAEGIVRSPEEAVVDRSRVVRMAGAMVGLMALFALYWLLSVKDPFTTAARIVAPWANIAPPSRVRINDVTPGVVTLVEGQPLDIEARITGLSDDEPAEVVITSADGQHVEDRFTLRYDQGLERYATSIPTLAGPTLAKNGQQAGLTGAARYRIEAGDGRSVSYDLTVLPAPAIVVEEIDFRFPAYTGLLDFTQETSGDLRGIERTRVTIHARSNMPMESAHIDFEGDGSLDLAMQVEGDTASASFDLALRPDRVTPRQTSYVLRIKTPAGLANSKPAKHQIDVYPDYPPEVELTAPEEAELGVRLNQKVLIQGVARDPDFALSDLRLLGECDGQRVVHKRLLTKPVRGKHEASIPFVPSQHGLQVGDVVEYWLEASDNRRPDPQTAVTQRQRFRILSPDARDNPPQNEVADAGEGEPDQQQGENGQERTRVKERAGSRAKRATRVPAEQGEGGAKVATGEAQDDGSKGDANEGEAGENSQSGGKQGQGKQGEQVDRGAGRRAAG